MELWYYGYLQRHALRLGSTSHPILKHVLAMALPKRVVDLCLARLLGSAVAPRIGTYLGRWSTSKRQKSTGGPSIHHG